MILLDRFIGTRSGLRGRAQPVTSIAVVALLATLVAGAPHSMDAQAPAMGPVQPRTLKHKQKRLRVKPANRPNSSPLMPLTVMDSPRPLPSKTKPASQQQWAQPRKTALSQPIQPASLLSIPVFLALILSTVVAADIDPVLSESFLTSTTSSRTAPCSAKRAETCVPTRTLNVSKSSMPVSPTREFRHSEPPCKSTLLTNTRRNSPRRSLSREVPRRYRDCLRGARRRRLRRDRSRLAWRLRSQPEPCAEGTGW